MDRTRFCPEDGERALLAQIVGNEVAGRLGAALFLGPHNGQFWASIHCGGAAAAAGVALGFDAERLAHAIAISLYQPPYGLWPGFMGPATKLLTAAEPAAQGARAALLAAEGVRGPLDVIEHRRGLLTNLAFVRRPAMLGRLGGVWLTDTLAYKPLPGCAYLQAAVDAALCSELTPSDVASVDVEAGVLTVAMEELAPAGAPTPARRQLLRGPQRGDRPHRRGSHPRAALPEWLSDHRADVEELAARVRVRHDWELTLETLRGPVEAGVSTADVGVKGWLGTARRMRELGMPR